MGIGKAFDAFGDWVTSGSDLASFSKIMGVTVLGIGALLSPFVYVAHKNSNELDSLIKEIDRSASVVFNSVAECKRDGYGAAACEESRKNAIDVAESLGTALSYSSRQACFNNHGMCSTVMVMIPMTVMSGNTPITTYIPTETHYPAVAGWQAMRSDIQKSVPLYTVNDSKNMVRRDGKVFKPAGM